MVIIEQSRRTVRKNDKNQIRAKERFYVVSAQRYADRLPCKLCHLSFSRTVFGDARAVRGLTFVHISIQNVVQRASKCCVLLARLNNFVFLSIFFLNLPW